MTRRANWLLIFALAVVSVTVYYGCSQTDDILTPVKKTTLTLTTQLLPTAPTGMVYELWVAGENDTIPVGRFNYDQDNLIFLNENMSTRADGGSFVFDGDLMAYSSVLVSVELTSDPAPTSPGPVMLMDAVTNPNDNPIRLVFPLSDSLWFSTCRYNMETPSDGNRGTNDGAGVWFTSYLLDTIEVQDTLGVSNVTIIDSTLDLPGDTCLTSFKSAVFDTIIDTIILGFDTIYHPTVRATYTDTTDCEAPYTKYIISFDVDTLPRVQHLWDAYRQDNFDLVEYAHWHYRGWVLSHWVEDAGASVGNLTIPPWSVNSIQLMLGSTEGGLISTGSFKNIEAADNGNPYSAGPRVPPFPGEDFLQNLPNGAAGPLNLVPNTPWVDGNGVVFITLEPDNYTTTTTNFPLVLLAGKIPSSRASVTGDLVQITMNQFVNTNNPVLGFPRIDVSIVRE